MFHGLSKYTACPPVDGATLLSVLQFHTRTRLALSPSITHIPVAMLLFAVLLSVAPAKKRCYPTLLQSDLLDAHHNQDVAAALVSAYQFTSTAPRPCYTDLDRETSTSTAAGCTFPSS